MFTVIILITDNDGAFLSSRRNVENAPVSTLHSRSVCPSISIAKFSEVTD